MSQQSYLLGQEAEAAVARYLQQRGLQLITRNYIYRYGEIDLIMRDKEMLVFVEVRLRRHHNKYATGLESITPSKQRRVIRTAEFYLQEKQLTDKIPCRFDVVSVTEQNGKFQFTWVPNAFWA